MEIYIAMRAADAAAFFLRLSAEAEEAIGRDGAFDHRLSAANNDGGGPATIIFNNDDMERPEMTGMTIVEVEID